MVLPLIDLLFDKYSNKKKPQKEQKSRLKEEKDLITASSKKYLIPTQYIASDTNSVHSFRGQPVRTAFFPFIQERFGKDE